jgi:hypothetical protein
LITLTDKPKSGEIKAPCNFRKNSLTFFYENERVYYRKTDHEIPKSIVQEAFKRNIAYEVLVDGEKLRFEELKRTAKDGEVLPAGSLTCARG